MTKKDYQLLADCIAKAHATVDTCYKGEQNIRAGHHTLNIVHRLISAVCYQDNHQFDVEQFATACNVWKETSPRYQPEDQTNDS